MIAYRFFTSFLAAVSASPRASLSLQSSRQSELVSCCCRSNSTHLAWRRSKNAGNKNAWQPDQCFWQPVEQAKQEAHDYLLRHVMAFDRPFLETMGFLGDDYNQTDAPDECLSANGLIGSVIDLAVRAKQAFAYTDALPKHIWSEYVLNYANLNEARNSIRPLLWERLIMPLLLLNNNTAASYNLTETVTILNTHMWRLLAPAGRESVVFGVGKSPAILDPMSVLAYGNASCTGLSILMVQALRAAGIPARIAGTAAWYGDFRQGNHNWVEVWDGLGVVCSCDEENEQDCQCGWSFLEPSPDQEVVDTLDRNPCERWFCQPDRFSQASRTKVFAARLVASLGGAHFPLAWERENTDVPAVDRTKFYQQVSSQCGSTDDLSKTQ